MKKRKTSITNSPIYFKIISYNVNGLRAVIKKGFTSYLTRQSADIVFLSETKTSDQSPISSLQSLYPHQYFNPSSKKGYSSTALFSKTKPLKVTFILPDAPDAAGRCITAVYPSFVLVGLYVLNAGQGLVRLKARTTKFDTALLDHISKIKEKYTDKGVMLCGDLNVAYLESDIYNPNEARNKLAGFTNAERINFGKMLDMGFVDAWLNKNEGHLYAEELEDKMKGYTWYSARGLWKKGGERGWRLDYFLVGDGMLEKVEKVEHDQMVEFSDHVPIILTLKDLDDKE